MIAVGTTLYRHDSWANDVSRRWSPVEVIGETKLSWLVGNPRYPTKVNKKTIMSARDFRGQNDVYCTVEERDSVNFCEKNKRQIASAVSVCNDPEKLRQIAAIVGKELSE